MQLPRVVCRQPLGAPESGRFPRGVKGGIWDTAGYTCIRIRRHLDIGPTQSGQTANNQ